MEKEIHSDSSACFAQCRQSGQSIQKKLNDKGGQTEQKGGDRTWWYIGMILLQNLLFGVNDPLTKILLSTVPVYVFLAFRYSSAVVLLMLFSGKTIIEDLKRVPVKKYIVPSMCLAVNFLLANSAMKITAATNVSFIKSLSGVFVSLLLLVFCGKKYSLRLVLIHLSAAAGVYLLCAKGGLSSSFGTGELLALASALCYAGSLAFGESAVRSVRPVTLTCMQAACSTVLAVIAGVFSGVFAETDLPELMTTTNVLIFIYEVVVCTILGNMLQNVALGHIRPSLVGILQCLRLLVTAATAYVLLGEKLSPAGMLGAGIIVASVVAEKLDSARPHPSEAGKK